MHGVERTLMLSPVSIVVFTVNGRFLRNGRLHHPQTHISITHLQGNGCAASIQRSNQATGVSVI